MPSRNAAALHSCRKPVFTDAKNKKPPHFCGSRLKHTAWAVHLPVYLNAHWTAPTHAYFLFSSHCAAVIPYTKRSAKLPFSSKISSASIPSFLKPSFSASLWASIWSVSTDKTILLIDDICTTGSTFESIIMQLHKSQIYNITCLATASVRF